jgi:hypothetical protein
MIPTFYRVVTPSTEWGVIYYVSNLRDIKVYEGHDYISNGFPAMAKIFGCPFVEATFTDEDEVDGCTPDTFRDIKGIKMQDDETT